MELMLCGHLLRSGNVCGLKAGHKGIHNPMSPERREYKKAWRESAAGLAWLKAYKESPDGRRACRKAYDESPEGRAARQTYNESPTGRAVNTSAKHKRRAAKAGATAEPFTQAELKARMASFGDACYYCALLGVVGPHECEDHVFPIQPRKGHKPGPHALRNLVPCCTPHNSQKHNKQPIDFINKLLATLEV